MRTARTHIIGTVALVLGVYLLGTALGMPRAERIAVAVIVAVVWNLGMRSYARLMPADMDQFRTLNGAARTEVVRAVRGGRAVTDVQLAPAAVAYAQAMRRLRGSSFLALLSPRYRRWAVKRASQAEEANLALLGPSDE